MRRAAALFNQFDHDRRGAVSPRSFFKVMKGVGKDDSGEEFSQSELQGMLRRADSDADGDVDFYELLQLLARQRRIQGAKQGEGARQRQERMEKQQAATEAGMARQDLKQARADAAAAVDAATAAKKAARDAELAEDNEDEAAETAEAAAADKVRRSGNHAGMQNQYRSMLLEELQVENWPELYPHLGEATIKACVSFFDKFDSSRTGRLEEDDFVRGMKIYGKLAKDSALSKRVHLEHVFAQADNSGDSAITIIEFVGHLAADGKLKVKPELFAEVSGFVKPDGMDFERAVEERKQQKGRWVEDDDKPQQRPDPDGSRIVNFMATQPASKDFLKGPSGGGRRARASERGTAAAVSAVSVAGPQRGGFMDRMTNKAAVGVGKMASMMGEMDIADGMDFGGQNVAPAHAARPDQTTEHMQKSQMRALERRKMASSSKDPIARMRSAEEEKRNEAAIERMALKNQNNLNASRRDGGRNAGNFVKKTGIDPKSIGSGNEGGLATRGMDKVLDKTGGGINKFLSNLAT